MNFKFIKQGILIASIMTAVVIPSGQSVAADIALAMPQQRKETKFDQNALLSVITEVNSITTEKTLKIESLEEIRFQEVLSKKTFVNMEDEFTYVVSSMDENSDWVGKVFPESAVHVLETQDEWTLISSGKVFGYVETSSLISGKDAIARAKEILEIAYPNRVLSDLDEEEIDNCFTVGETREDEEARLAEEEAMRIAEEEARIAEEQMALQRRGQDVVDFARQFCGNPYVWGGTSLTRGADCSGFVKAVYAHFGISMPRTSRAMRSSGYAVSLSEIMPGDVVCYQGHVGIYAGNGQIVNAIDSSKGIGMSNLHYANIITIRRMF